MHWWTEDSKWSFFFFFFILSLQNSLDSFLFKMTVHVSLMHKAFILLQLLPRSVNESTLAVIYDVKVAHLGLQSWRTGVLNNHFLGSLHKLCTIHWKTLLVWRWITLCNSPGRESAFGCSTTPIWQIHLCCDYFWPLRGSAQLAAGLFFFFALVFHLAYMHRNRRKKADDRIHVHFHACVFNVGEVWLNQWASVAELESSCYICCAALLVGTQAERCLKIDDRRWCEVLVTMQKNLFLRFVFN